MKSQLFIAKKIKVGFNLRPDTYTGKLGYVIGHDGKKWRKEPSWEGWRLKFNSPEEVQAMKVKQFNDNVEAQKKSHKSYIEYYKKNPHYESYKKYAEMTEIEFLTQNHLDDFDKWSNGNRFHLSKVSDNEGIKPVEFDNVPTEGFVLNKKTGGYSTGWNHRSTYCRVYDPRGFEFEINIPNLLFILQETSSFKGKGLEGEFVYAWDGKDLVLLPAHCEEYKQSQGFTKLQDGKVGVKDLTSGCSYKTKKQIDLIYLGKFNWYSLKYSGRKYNSDREISSEKFHIFYDAKNNNNNFSRYQSTENYVIVSGLSSLASKNSDTPVDNYAELMEEFSKSKYSAKPVSIKETPKEIKLPAENYSNWLRGSFYKKDSNGEYDAYTVYAFYDYPGGQYQQNAKTEFKNFTLSKHQRVVFKDGKLTLKSYDYNHRTQDRKYSKQELETMNLQELFVVLDSGKEIKLENY